MRRKDCSSRRFHRAKAFATTSRRSFSRDPRSLSTDELKKISLRRVARGCRARRRDRLQCRRRDDRVAPRDFHQHRRHPDLAGVRVFAGRLLRRRANRRRPSGNLRHDRPAARVRMSKRRLARRADAESFAREILRRPCHRGARTGRGAGAQAAGWRSCGRYRPAFQCARLARNRSAIRARPIAR